MSEFELAEGVRSLPRDEWNALVGDESPFLEWDWLASLEESGAVGAETGWLARPLVARGPGPDGGRLIAACPLYVKAHSEGEFVFDWSWADAAERSGIAYYPKLLVGVPFTPVSGARLLVAPGADRHRWVRRLAQALRGVCLANELSGVHVNFCQAVELDALCEEGFLPRVGVQYHWHNHDFESFDDYLGALRSKRRNQIRRERRSLAEQGLAVETLVGDEIDDDLFAPMFRFYLSTIRSRAWGRQYLNERFFELVRERFRHRLCFVVARADGHPVGGTFNVVKGDALYGRYWGADRDVRYLHFNVCYYAAIDLCIRRGLARFEPGAGGDYKQVRGFDAQPTWSAHFLAQEELAAAVDRFLEMERNEAHATIAWLRDRSAFKAPPTPRSVRSGDAVPK